MKELDVLLTRYIDDHGATMDDDGWTLFEALLTESDMDLFAWFTGRTVPAEPRYADLVRQICRRPST